MRHEVHENLVIIKSVCFIPSLFIRHFGFSANTKLCDLPLLFLAFVCSDTYTKLFAIHPSHPIQLTFIPIIMICSFNNSKHKLYNKDPYAHAHPRTHAHTHTCTHTPTPTLGHNTGKCMHTKTQSYNNKQWKIV